MIYVKAYSITLQCFIIFVILAVLVVDFSDVLMIRKHWKVTFRHFPISIINEIMKSAARAGIALELKWIYPFQSLNAVGAV